MRKRGLSYRQIQRIIKKKYDVQLHLSVISKWAHRKQHPLQDYNKLIPGPELAYAISAWLGDGRLAHTKRYREYSVCLAVKDYDFAEKWGQCIAKALGREKPYRPRWEKSSRRWVTRARSKLLYDLLRKAKNNPWILMPYLESYPSDACRGFFDAEGGANTNSYELVAYNTDLRVIQLFAELLKRIGIQCSIREVPYKSGIIYSPVSNKVYHRNKYSCFRLTIYGKENILKFAEEVGFIISRKRAELARILERYQRIKIRSNCLEKCARTLITANLVRLGLVKTQTEAAKLLSIKQSTISDCLHNKKKLSKLLKHPEIEELSREYITSRSDYVIMKTRKILQIIIEIFSG